MTASGLRRQSVMAWLAAAGLLAACTAPVTTAGRGKPTKAPSQAPTRGPALTTPSPAAVAHMGRVLGLDGLPAAGVRVTAVAVAGSGGGVVSNNGAGVISNGGASIISDHGGSYRLRAEGPVTGVTGPDGRFSLPLEAGKTYTVEAVAKADDQGDLKAIRGGVVAADRSLELRLAPPGSLRGRLLPPSGAVTNMQGVEVYIPGTSYMARADAEGRFRIDGVPVGTYRLVAEKAGLGSALSGEATVRSGAETEVPAFALALAAVTVTAVEPPVAMRGSRVTVTGTRFDKSRGAPFKLRLGGVEVENVAVESDTRATFVAPAGAKGPLVVEVDGVKSAEVPFGVVEKLEIGAPDVSLSVSASFKCPVRASDAAGLVMAQDPAVSWRRLSGTAARVDDQGVITAEAAGVATFEASCQGWTAQVPVTVTERSDPAGWLLGGAPVQALKGLRHPAVDAAGNIHVASERRLLTLGSDGTATVLAGADDSGVPSSRDEVGQAARFAGLDSLWFDTRGNRLLLGDGVALRAVALPGAVVTTLIAEVAAAPSERARLDNPAILPGVSAVVTLPGDAEGKIYLLVDGTLHLMRAGARPQPIPAAKQVLLIAPAPGGTLMALTASGLHRLVEDSRLEPVPGVAEGAAWPISPWDVVGFAVDDAARVHLARPWGLLRVSPETGVPAPFAGRDDGQAPRDGTLAEAQFSSVTGLHFDAARQRLVVTQQDAVRSVDLTRGEVRTIAHSVGPLRYLDALPPAAASGTGGETLR